VALLERDELIARLRGAAGNAWAGNGAVVLVSGEAGAGKTALVRAGTDDAVWGYCEPLTTPRPLGPFRDIERDLWTITGRSEPLAVADRLLRHLDGPGRPLVVEDAHWIDTSSAEVLRFVGRRIGQTHGLIVVIARYDPASALRATLGDLADAVVRLDVPPLSAAAVGKLVAPSGIDVAEAMRLTGGNAFLATQLGTTQTLLRDSVAARRAQLGAAARELAELLCVVPGRIPAELVASRSAQGAANRRELLSR
jgi:predicted ATPase